MDPAESSAARRARLQQARIAGNSANSTTARHCARHLAEHDSQAERTLRQAQEELAEVEIVIGGHATVDVSVNRLLSALGADGTSG